MPERRRVMVRTNRRKPEKVTRVEQTVEHSKPK